MKTKKPDARKVDATVLTPFGVTPCKRYAAKLHQPRTTIKMQQVKARLGRLSRLEERLPGTACSHLSAWLPYHAKELPSLPDTAKTHRTEGIVKPGLCKELSFSLCRQIFWHGAFARYREIDQYLSCQKPTIFRSAVAFTSNIIRRGRCRVHVSRPCDYGARLR